LLVEVIENLEQLAREKGVALQINHPRPLPAVQGDKDKLNQVLTNVIHNAIKFTPSGGWVSVSSDLSETGMVEISVADSGCGIPPHQIQHVFDKFYHADSAPAESRGAGLGLAIVKSLLELHGGEIEVESTLGSGSRFRVTLPCERPTPHYS